MTKTNTERNGALLTTGEVLGYLRVTSRTIYRLIRAGELPAVRIGRQWRFRRADLDDWLDQKAVSGSASAWVRSRARRRRRRPRVNWAANAANRCG